MIFFESLLSWSQGSGWTYIELKAIWEGGELAMPAMPVYLGQKTMFSLPDPFPS